MKHDIATQALREEFGRWDKALASTDDSLAQAEVYMGRRLKDEVAHLWMWQLVSVARMEGALAHKAPDLSWWAQGIEPEVEMEKEAINEWIYESNLDRSWGEVYGAWRENFERFISLSEKAAKAGLLQVVYEWLNGYALVAVIQGSVGHHQEHWKHLRKVIKQ